jgi:pimeloyl-ACP methyl ester carboxylesterase
VARGDDAARVTEQPFEVVVVYGELSALPLWSARDTAGLVPGSGVAVVPDAGHFPWVERPGSVQAAAGPFLAVHQ